MEIFFRGTKRFPRRMGILSTFLIIVYVYRHLVCLYNTFKQRNILKFNKGEERACWKNNFKKLSFLFLTILALILLTSCKKVEVELAYFKGITAEGLYNKNLFYRNDLEIKSADPHCIFVEHGEEKRLVLYVCHQ